MDSLIKYDNNRVLTAARKVKEDIEKIRASLWESKIEEAMEPRRTWFRTKTRTREEAIDYLSNDCAYFYSTKTHCEIIYFRKYDLACSMIKAAEENTEIYLTVDDASLLELV